MKRQLILFWLTSIAFVASMAAPINLDVKTSDTYNPPQAIDEALLPPEKSTVCSIVGVTLSHPRKAKRVQSNVREWKDTDYNVIYEYNPEDSTACVKAGILHANDNLFQYSDPWSPFEEHGSAGSPEATGHILVRSSITVDGKKFSVKSIGTNAFAYNSQITSVDIEEGVKIIEEFAFTFCTGITSIALPNTIDTISYGCFRHCEQLRSLHIPASVSYIGKSILPFCKNMESLTVAEDNIYYDSRDNCQAIIETATNTLIAGTLRTIIPENVTAIGSRAFLGRSLLKNIYIPSSVKAIGPVAFGVCENLESINIPEQVTKIDSATFCACNSLRCISIPNIITSIEENAFTYCKSLKMFVLPASVKGIGECAFRYCSSLETINIPDGITKIEDYTFDYCESLREIVLPESVKGIGIAAFQACGSLESINIPEEVDSIGPWGFWGCGFEEIELPASLSKIGRNAFCKCIRLKAINIPEGVENIELETFYGCSSLREVTIPATITSIGDWAFYGCSSLESVNSYITDVFPFHSRAFNFSEGNAVFSPHATLYVPFDTKSRYESTEGWNVFNNIVEIFQIGVSVSLSVLDEIGNELTSGYTVSWYNGDGSPVATGTTINGISSGTLLSYSIELNNILGRIYREVNKIEIECDGSPVTCQLERISRLKLTGRVLGPDAEGGAFTVLIRQLLNGKYEETFTTQTDEQGVFTLDIYDDVTDIVVSRDGYLDVALHRDRFNGHGNVGIINVRLISGAVVATNILYRRAVKAGEDEQVIPLEQSLNNIEYKITNRTKGKEITDFTIQSTGIIIRNGVTVGDEIAVEVTSKQGIFAGTHANILLTENDNVLNLTLMELGGIDVTLADGDGSYLALLYDDDGNLVARCNYVGSNLSIRHLHSGTYTLISMCRNALFGNITRLVELSASGLSAGTDYVETPVTIRDGEISGIDVSAIPKLDASGFYFTDKSTYLNANKASVTAGSYVTISAQIQFKPEIDEDIDGVEFSVDIPDGCQFVQNSAIIDRQPVIHSVDGNHVSFSLTKEQRKCQLRFCVMPLQEGDFIINAYVSFRSNGEMRQPIGSASFKAKGLSLNVQETTNNSSITVSGTAIGVCDVGIYDDDILIGTAQSMADGSWTAQCNLHNPYSYSYHDIRAKIRTIEGLELLSQSKRVIHNENGCVPVKVTMLNRNNQVEVDFLNKTTTPSYYTYVPGYPDFTFIAELSNNSTEVIQDVIFKVLATDGTVRTIPATFDSKQGKWVGATQYSSSDKLPVNVKIEYTDATVTPLFSSRMAESYSDIISNMIAEIENAYKDCDVEFIREDEGNVYFSAITNEYGTKENYRMEFIDYEQAIRDYSDKSPYHLVDGTTDLCFLASTNDDGNSSLIVWDNLSQKACGIYEITDDATKRMKPRRILPFLLSTTYGIGASVFEYNIRMKELMIWNQAIEEESKRFRKQYDRILQSIYARCKDGSYKIKDNSVLNNELDRANQWQSAAREYLYDFQDMVEIARNRLKQLCTLKGIANVGLSGMGLALKGASTLVQNASGWVANTMSKLLISSAETAIVEGSGQALSVVAGNNLEPGNPEHPNYRTSPEDLISQWHTDNLGELTEMYVSLTKDIPSKYSRCEKKDDEDNDDEPADGEDFPTPSANPAIDPSGYVYEAVTSNRLSGVKVTCYQLSQNEDMYGNVTKESLLWNAADYSQQNPLITDETGFYRWDVPQGMWQVRYEKEGYETTYSDWLPVPPPQLDVNIGMKQSTPPTVKMMQGVETGITIEMSKYMQPESITDASVVVTREGVAQRGHIEMLNLEEEPLGEACYVSRIKFVPDMQFNPGDEVTVTVTQNVQSYCGVPMGNDYTQSVIIASEISAILADSTISIPYGETRTMQVVVTPKEAAVGRTLVVTSSSSMIVSLDNNRIAIDENGTAGFTVGGNLPGGAILTLYVDGAEIKKDTKVSVINGHDLVSIPVASIRTGDEVAAGTMLSFSCSTPGATIYYTLDGSCPCDESTHIEYTEPFILPSGVITIKAMAIADDMDNSDVVTFIYVVGSEDVGIENTDAAPRLEARLIGGVLTIGGAEGSTVRVYDVAGRELATYRNAKPMVSLRMPQTECIVSATTAGGQTVVKKVMRR